MERTGTTRRRALFAGGAAATAALTGCSADETGPRRATTRSESAETVLRRRSAELSTALLRRYDAVLTAHPALAARLSPLRSEVVRHVEALAPTGSRPLPGTSPAPSASRPPSSPVSPAPAASGPARPGPSSAASPAAPSVAADAGTAVRELAAAERTTADAHTAALGSAPPEYARLLASVAAAGAVHAYLLTEGSR